MQLSSVFPVRGKDRIVVLFHKFYHSSGVLRVWESSFSFTRVPASPTVAPHSRVLCDLHGRMSSGPPQSYFVEILWRGDNTPISAYGGDGAGCGLTIKGLNDRCLLCAVSPACGKNTAGSLGRDIKEAASSACGKNPFRNAIRFPVTKVPVSTIVALHSKVLRNLPGRIGSGLPQPYRF